MTRRGSRHFRLIAPVHAWAIRDVLRRPAESLFLMAALFIVVVLSGTSLLLMQAAGSTVGKAVEAGPSLVVKRAGPLGWLPLPVREAVGAARSVTGVNNAHARIWGIAAGPDTPVTIVGATPDMAGRLLENLPKRGTAQVGPGVAPVAGRSLRINGTRSIDLQVTRVFSHGWGLAVHDLVFVHPDDARMVLGLPNGYATDVAVDVFNNGEEKAIIPDLSAAFPWPVTIVSRGETAGYYKASLFRRGGIGIVALIPAVIAMIMIMSHNVGVRTGAASEVGLLKSYGWTTGDVVRVELLRAVFLSVPASLLGMLVSWLLVFLPRVSWPAYLFLGWESNGPRLLLDTGGAFLVAIEVVSLTVVPFALSALWPALRNAAADPLAFLMQRSD